jgi:hypothetical protein
MKNFAKISALLALLPACTGQLADAFRYQQAKEAFNTETEINTKIDLLWVVDNSSSMDIAQKNIREKVAGFANRYLSPSWDIRIGVITTDAYLANPVFANYLNSEVGGSRGFRSNHLNLLIADRQGRGLTTSNDSKLAKLSALNVSFASGTRGTFSSGYLFKDLVPAWASGTDYARLLPGLRDGPISGLCVESQSYFFAENPDGNPNILGPQCTIRDAADRTGNTTCLNPDSGQTSVTECVNTSLNDTVRSGKAIISTQLPAGQSVSAWKQQLSRDFMVNISVGSVGGGSERGLSSVDEFLRVNETSASRFFRAGSLRGVIFLTDEDDQSMRLPSIASVPAGYNPFSDYRCDLQTLVDANVGKFADPQGYISTTFQYCCSGTSCRYANLGCAAKTVEGTDFKVGVCPDSTKLIPVQEFADKITDHFYQLDGLSVEAGQAKTAAGANFFTMAIVPLKASVITSLRNERNLSDDRLDDIKLYNGATLTTSKRIRIPSVDYGERYKQFVEKVGNGSLALDIGEADYSVILDHIGKTLIDKKSRFPLKFFPSKKSDMLVSIIRADGSSIQLVEDQYDYEGKTLIILDEDLVLSLKASDKLFVDYQPASLE